jgi:hypothetical protein
LVEEDWLGDQLARGGKLRHDGAQLYGSLQVKPQDLLVEPGIPLGSYTLRPEGVVPGSCKSI